MQSDTHDPSDKSVVELSSEHWRLRLEPHTGLQTQSCQIRHHDAWHNLMPDTRPGAEASKTTAADNDIALKASNFHMLPYSNRIRDGRFNFNGQAVQLEDAANHSIHGALRKLPWRVTSQTDTSVTAEYDTLKDGSVNWPWPIHASISYTLDNNQLLSRMSLTNHGDRNMPAGMGWHPYFCRTIDGAEPELTIAVDGMYPDTNGDCLPTGPAIALNDELNFKTPKKLDSAVRIDHCFSGLSSPVTLHWPNAGIKVLMHASANCNHLVLFNPAQAYFAVEPVTNANDGFNLSAQGVDAGVTTLAPSQTMTAEMQLVLEAPGFNG